MHVTPNPKPAESKREVHPFQAEHAAIFACAQELRGTLARLAASAAHWLEEPEVGRLLSDFQRRILAHLHAEERSGAMELAATTEPRFANRVDELRRQHGDLRERLAALLEQAPTLDTPSLRAGFEAFCSVLRAHERAENEVLQCVYLDDIGGRG